MAEFNKGDRIVIKHQKLDHFFKKKTEGRHGRILTVRGQYKNHCLVILDGPGRDLKYIQSEDLQPESPDQPKLL